MRSTSRDIEAALCLTSRPEYPRERLGDARDARRAEFVRDQGGRSPIRARPKRPDRYGARSREQAQVLPTPRGRRQRHSLHCRSQPHRGQVPFGRPRHGDGVGTVNASEHLRRSSLPSAIRGGSQPTQPSGQPKRQLAGEYGSHQEIERWSTRTHRPAARTEGTK